jgi:hypothetical protein
MLNPISAFWKWLRKPDTLPEGQMQRSIEPRLSCCEIMLARQAMIYLEKQGYRYAMDARVDRIGNHCYLVFPSNEDPKNSKVEILLY